MPLDRLLPWLTFALGVAIIWIPPWPPMADLPQAAAQIGTLKDLLFGRSPWADEVRINYFTPYLIGYAVAVPLALVMPVAAALKMVMSLAYGLFGLVAMRIGRELGAARRLDAWHFVGFFGFAYTWGLYTFLVAAPVGLAFVWLAILYARRGGLRLGIGLSLLGVVLLFSHGLVFLLALAIAGAILWAQDFRIGRTAVRAWPLAPPLVVAGLIFLVTRRSEPELVGGLAAVIDMGPLLVRALRFACGPFGLPGLVPLGCFALMASTPFVAGLRVDLRRRESLLIAAGFIGAAALAPDWLWGTLFVQPRLTLFLPSAWAWLFSEPASPKVGPITGRGLAPLAAAVAWLALAPHLAQALRFSAESRDFTAVFGQARPGHRALGLIFDQATRTGVDPAVYEYFPSWYQAEKQGFVDYSLANFHTEVVRFRHPPAIYADGILPFHPERFDWRRDDGDRYDYVFTRSAGPLPRTLFAGAPCPPRLAASQGEWRLFERCDAH
jgi:hypothetical protein